MILLIDNYDSFVHNLSRYLRELGCETVVSRNDAVSIADIRRLAPRAIVISPGPGHPADAGISIELVRPFSRSIPILGVCLGHQAIAAAFGAEIVRAPCPVHGQTSDVFHDGTGLFAELSSPLRATRYHSLTVHEPSLPAELTITARTAEGLIMGLQHRNDPVFGVQFHPESILTENGHRLLAAFLSVAGIPAPSDAPGEVQDAVMEENSVPLPHPLHW